MNLPSEDVPWLALLRSRRPGGNELIVYLDPWELAKLRELAEDDLHFVYLLVAVSRLDMKFRRIV